MRSWVKRHKGTIISFGVGAVLLAAPFTGWLNVGVARVVFIVGLLAIIAGLLAEWRGRHGNGSLELNKPESKLVETIQSRLSNRKELISAIHQVKETAGNAILTSAVLGEVHKIGKEPPQQFVADFSNAFDKYREALKSLEREALIAGEVFHSPLNSFFAKINSCVQNPAPPIRQPGSTVVCLDNPENANKLNAAMNEVVKEIDEINQSASHKGGSQS